jgi:hypothetical protein
MPCWTILKLCDAQWAIAQCDRFELGLSVTGDYWSLNWYYSNSKSLLFLARLNSKIFLWLLVVNIPLRSSSLKVSLCLQWQDCRVDAVACSPCLRLQPALTAVVETEWSLLVGADWDDLAVCWSCYRDSTSSTLHMLSVWMSCWDEDLNLVATVLIVGPTCSG